MMDTPHDKFGKKLGLALGGGGARGLAHIGVLKVFEREGIPIHYLSGTSMGGMIAAIYASGVSPEDIEKEASRRGTNRELIKLIDLKLSQRGLFKGQRIYNQLAEGLGAGLTFADLHKPVAMVATDMLTGREVILNEGNVIDAVRATISVPGIFLPYDYGAYKLVDGGILNNLPVDVVRQMGADIVIGVDVLPRFSRNLAGETPNISPLNPPKLPTLWKDILNIELIMISAMTELRSQIAQPELVIYPELPSNLDILLSFDRFEVAIRAGEEAATAALPMIREIMSN